MVGVGFLGPEGTFTHEAALRAQSIPTKDAIGYTSVEEVIRAVANGEVGAGVIPVENTVDGEVYSTLEQLALEAGRVQISEELILPIRLGLYGLSTTSSPKSVLSHRNALAQCANYLAEHNLETTEVASTAEACRQVVALNRDDVVALASSGAAERYGLSIVAEDVGDDKTANTRFAVVSSAVGKPTGRDRTLFALTAPSFGFRVVRDIVNTFVGRAEITRLLVRRIRGENKSTMFLTCKGHVSDPLIQTGITSLFDRGVQVVCVGSYAEVDQ